MSILPRDVSRRILKRCRTSKAVVVVSRNGKPSRVYDLDTYLRRVQNTRTVQPWKFRKKKRAPEPLGTVDGRVISPLRREYIYE